MPIHLSTLCSGYLGLMFLMCGTLLVKGVVEHLGVLVGAILGQVELKLDLHLGLLMVS